LFALFFDRPKFRDLPLPRKRYLIRFFTQLFDLQTESIIKYAHSSSLVVRLVEHVESDDVKEVLGVLLASEKKYVDRSITTDIDFTLVETSKIETFLCSHIRQNGLIGITDNFFRVLTSVRGFSSPVVANVIKFDSFNIVKATLDLISTPSSSYDAVMFFSDIILRIISLNDSLMSDFVNVVAENMNSTKSVISNFSQPASIAAPSSPSPSTTLTEPSSPSTSSSLFCQLHSSLLLVDGLVKRSIGLSVLVKPLLLNCLNTFFKVKLGNVIHFIISGIIVACLEQQQSELIDTLVNDGHMIEKILEFSEQKDTSVAFRGHLLLVAKSMNSCPQLEEKLLSNDKWQQFSETSVKEFLNKSICPPDAALLAAKQRQIQKAGGSFLG